MIYIISYPRSGNTATRYLIELLTRKPTDGLIGARNPKDNLQDPLIHKKKYDYVAKKRHDFKGVHSSDMVIYVIRDYLECIVRHNEQIRGITKQQMEKYIDSWFLMLWEYDEFRGNKMLWHYDEVLKIASIESRAIYKNAQSGDDKNHHKAKLGKKLIKELQEYAQKKYPFLIAKYLT